MNWKAVSNTGLNQRELAAIFRVTRVAFNNWLHGRTNPHPQIAPRVQTLLKAFQAAAAAKAFPVVGATSEARIAAAKKILRAYLT